MNQPNSCHSKNRRHTLQTLLSLLLIVAVMTLVGFSTAHATAMAEADVQAQLTFTSSSGIDITFFDSFPVFDTVENDNASAMAQAPDLINLGNGIQFSSSATATASPTGFASGLAAAFGSVELTNTTPSPIDVDFTLVYEWTIQGSSNDPSLEQARASIALDVFINDVSLGHILEDNTTPPNFSMGSGSPITQTFSGFSIPAGTTLLEVATAAQAEASSAAVPEPATLLLLSSGIVGLGLYCRLRRI